MLKTNKKIKIKKKTSSNKHFNKWVKYKNTMIFSKGFIEFTFHYIIATLSKMPFLNVFLLHDGIYPTDMSPIPSGS